MAAERAFLSIGDVLALLKDEFPDVTISKIRFLESQGLLDPERTPSGYRKFYETDVDRLRWILRQQREHFLPLKVIKDRLGDVGPLEEDQDLTSVFGGVGEVGSLDYAATPANNGSEPQVPASRPGAVGSQAPSQQVFPPPALRVMADPPAPVPLSSTAAPGPAAGIPAAQTPVAQTPVAPAAQTPAAAAAQTPAAAAAQTPVAQTPVAQTPVAPAPYPVAPFTPAPSPAPPASPSGPAAPTPSVAAPTGAVPGSIPSPLSAGPAAMSLTADELTRASGLSPDGVAELERYGLLSGRVVAGTTYYDEEAFTVATAAAGFAAHGIEPRHLRMYKTAADREGDLYEQVVTPLLKQRNPQARSRAVADLAELARLGQRLRASLLRVALREHTGG